MSAEKLKRFHVIENTVLLNKHVIRLAPIPAGLFYEKTVCISGDSKAFLSHGCPTP